ncbi:MAG: NAD(P)/FAD-dependent oxidoreductase [Candidatus Taylorbacteria bacterium]|nr:NAD(P)/FAD-dependent oxidoreductase [Candidatus Taylorbacteria bacterium]
MPIKVKPASAKSYGEAKDNWISELAGVSLQDVGISVWSLDHSRDKQSEKLRSDLNFQKVFKRQGKVLFTHEGLSGPAILNMSKDVGELLSYGNEVKISLDFFSGIGLDVLQEKFKKIFEENKNKKVKNLAFKEVPVKIFEKVLELTGVDGDWNINQIMKEERVMILEKLRKFDFTVEKLLGFDKSIVSSGGLDLKEVDFKTMQSKLYENLFFAGAGIQEKLRWIPFFNAMTEGRFWLCQNRPLYSS